MKPTIKNRIELHGQIKAFYSVVFNGVHDIRPTHISLYMFLLNQNNRNMWVEWFKCPYDLAMQGAGIHSKTTYYSILDDLVKFNLIEYVKGVNLFKAPLIKIRVLTIPKNDIVTVPLSDTVTGTLSGTLSDTVTDTLSGNIIRLVTDNLLLITNNTEEFEKFILFLKNKENPKPTKITADSNKKEKVINAVFEEFRNAYPGSKRAYETEFTNFQKKHKDWKEVLPTLQGILTRQFHAKEQNKKAGAFVSNWQNLQTYINQRSWEIEIEIETVTPKNNTGYGNKKPLAERLQNTYDLIDRLYPDQ